MNVKVCIYTYIASCQKCGGLDCLIAPTYSIPNDECCVVHGAYLLG